MAKMSARVVLNRKAFDTLTLGAADGLLEFSKDLLLAVHPPSDVAYETAAEHAEEVEQKRPPLAQNGGALVFIGFKKVAGWGLDGRQPKRPYRTRLSRTRIQALAGFGFPGRFNEMGTIHQPSRPFFSPVIAEKIPDAQRTVKAGIKRFLNRLG